MYDILGIHVYLNNKMLSGGDTAEKKCITHVSGLCNFFCNDCDFYNPHGLSFFKQIDKLIVKK